MLPNLQEYQNRRARLLAAMGKESIAILMAAREYLRNGDSHYPYRQNSDFYYLTGFKEPEAVAVFIPGRSEGEFILFNRERDPAMEIWNGLRAGQQGACKVYGAHQSFPIEHLDEIMPKLLENKTRVYYPVGRDMSFNRRILSWVSQVQAKIRSGVHAPSEFYNIEKIVHEMRLFKSESELDIMRQAANITAKAHCQAMQACRPGMMEYELEAEIQYVFGRHGARAPAYNHIVGSGANACILHYNDNNQPVKSGDLVLIDAGAEYKEYAADITRTFPANGRFTEPQKAIYSAVLEVQLAVIAAIKPGLPWNQLQVISERTMVEQLLQLGLLSGSVEELIEKRAFFPFYMHRIGHWLGLDVHDVGEYKVNNDWRRLEPGMTFTVEPGIYIAAGTPGVDEKWWNIGVRIEDDVLVTQEGCEVLTSGVPKRLEDIESLMANTLILA